MNFLINDNWRFLPNPNPKSKRGYIAVPPTTIVQPNNIIYSPVLSPVLSPTAPVFSPIAPFVPPGVFFTNNITGTTAAGTAATGTAATGTAATGTAAAGTTASPAATSALLTATGNFSVVTPPITNIRHLTNPDLDPELQRKVIKHFYKELKEKYFFQKFQNFFKYIVIENNNPRLVKSEEELQKNSNNNDSKLKIKFITDNIFTKYDLEVLISKLIAKYSMLFSEDEYNLHWYNIKSKHSSLVKKAIYKKIKYRIEKKLSF